MRRISVLAGVLLLIFSLSFAGCDNKAYSGQVVAAAMSNEREGGGEVTMERLGDNRIEYIYKRDSCPLVVTITRHDEGYETASVGWALLSACRELSYQEKLGGISLLLERAKDDGRLINLRRVGPGPGSEMCKGEIRKRLLQTTLDKLSDPEFVHHNSNFISGQGNRLDEKYLFEEADAFREYKEIFQRIGYTLEIEDYEGVVFEKVKRKDWPKDYKMLSGEIAVPCNAMVYFRAERM